MLSQLTTTTRPTTWPLTWIVNGAMSVVMPSFNCADAGAPTPTTPTMLMPESSPMLSMSRRIRRPTASRREARCRVELERSISVLPWEVVPVPVEYRPLHVRTQNSVASGRVVYGSR